LELLLYTSNHEDLQHGRPRIVLWGKSSASSILACHLVNQMVTKMLERDLYLPLPPLKKKRKEKNE